MAIKTDAMAVLKTQSWSRVPTETPLTFQVETITGVVYDVQEKQGLCFTCISPASPVADFGTKVPLLYAAAQNYSTPKPELPLERAFSLKPTGWGQSWWMGCSYRQTQIRNILNFYWYQIIQAIKDHSVSWKHLWKCLQSRICKPTNIWGHVKQSQAQTQIWFSVYNNKTVLNKKP